MNKELNDPQSLNNSTKKIVIFFAGLVVIVLVFFVVFAILNRTEKQLNILSNTSNQDGKNVDDVKNEQTDKFTENKEVEGAFEPLKGEASKVSSEEKRKIGIPDFAEVKALLRNEAGDITAYKIVVDETAKDSDGDGISDIQEKNLGTDPNNPDTDGDGVSDWQELATGKDPLNKDDVGKK